MKPLLTLALIVLMPLMGQAQQKRALFLHGFNGGADSWMSTNTPQDWVARGVIHDYVNYTYTMDQLASQTTLNTLHSQIADAMYNHFEDQWVIVGHSLGGLLARTVYAYIESHPYYSDLNIVGVLTIGTPHQGARAAAVAAPEIGMWDPSCPAITTVPAGYLNVQPVFDEFLSSVNPPLHNVHALISVAAFYQVMVAGLSLNTLNDAPKILPKAFCELKVWEQLSIDSGAKDKIGASGTLIQTINQPSFITPSNRRSVIGAEKAYVPVRAAADAIGLNAGNEKALLGNFEETRYFYQLNRDAYANTESVAWFFCYMTLDFDCPEAHAAANRKNMWQKGRDGLTNVDTYWARVIDEVTATSTTVWTWQPIGSCGAPEINPENPPKATHADQTSECIDGVEYGYVPVTTTVHIPKKNDVLLGPAYAVWSPGQNPNDQSVNFLYDDLPTDGGYNHFELRRSKRAYSLPGVFNAGDPAPPIQEAETWLLNVFQ